MTETKDQQECQYCHDKIFWGNDSAGGSVTAGIDGKNSKLWTMDPFNTDNNLEAEINYCPLCGRKLAK